MQTLLDLFRESVILQSIITVIVVTGFVVDIVQDGVASPELKDLTLIIVAFYFGAKSTNSAKQLMEKITHPPE